MPRLTNPTNGPKGAWITEPGALFGGSTVWVESNAYVDVKSISKAERQSFEAAGGAVVDNPLDPDGDGKMGGSVAAVVDARKDNKDDAPAVKRGRPPKAK